MSSDLAARAVGLLRPGALGRALALLLITSMALAGCHSVRREPQAPVDPAKAERMAVFDEVVTTVGAHTAPLLADEVDWEAVVARYRPLAEASPSTEALYGTLDRMLSELGISHMKAVAPTRDDVQAQLMEASEPDPAGATPSTDAGEAHGGAATGPQGDAGLDFRWVGDQLVVRSVKADGPAALAGVTPGMSILRIGDVKVEKAWPDIYLSVNRMAEAELLVRRTFLVACQGVAGETVDIDAVDLSGARRSFSFPLERKAAKVMSFGHLNVEGELEAATLAGGVGYVRWNVFMMDLMPELEKAIRGFKDAPGLVLDLRGNPGGVAAMSGSVGGMLTDKLLNLGVMQSEGMEMRFPVFPKYGAYLGPVAILVDGTSASTSEIFAAGLQELGRAVVVGEVSAGMVLPSLIIELPDGGLLQYATALYRTPKGRILEGKGVTPNVVVEPDPAAWSRGEDPPVETARRLVMTLSAGEHPAP